MGVGINLQLSQPIDYAKYEPPSNHIFMVVVLNCCNRNKSLYKYSAPPYKTGATVVLYGGLRIADKMTSLRGDILQHSPTWTSPTLAMVHLNIFLFPHFTEYLLKAYSHVYEVMKQCKI